MELLKKSLYELLKVVITAALAAFGLVTTGCFHMQF